MKQLVLIGLLFNTGIHAAELAKTPPMEYRILPKEICMLVAKNETGYELFDLENREDQKHDTSYQGEQLRMSATWNTATLIPEFNLMEHQLWYSHHQFRFDNDTTHDCSEFQLLEPVQLGEKIAFDGPNNDGGRHGGVILVGRSDNQVIEQKKTRFYLFKQHNKDVRNYGGIQQKKRTYRTEGVAFNYQNFPYESEPLLHQSLDFCALAPRGRGLIATTDAVNVHHLHVFDYKYIPNDTDPSKADQSFQVMMRAHASNVPLFSQLAWIYGRTLLGITSQNELYVVAVKEEAGKPAFIECFKQKTEKKFKNFGVRRPDAHYQIFLCDTENKLYAANLKRRTMDGAFILKLLSERTEVKEGDTVKMIEKTPELFSVDRVWAYEDTLMAMNLKDAKCALFKMTPTNTPEIINKKLHELKKAYEAKKAAQTPLIDNQALWAFEECTLELHTT